MTEAISQGFIDSASRWSTAKQGFVPTVADCRGAIVLAYYAVFHRLAEICADELVGNRADNVNTSRAWNEYYRSLDHSRVRVACGKVLSSELFSSSVEVFCDWFPSLLEARELCNYEALVEPNFEETSSILYTAEECINSLNNIEESERKDFVAWMILATTGGVKKRRDRNFRKDAVFFEKFYKNSSADQ